MVAGIDPKLTSQSQIRLLFPYTIVLFDRRRHSRHLAVAKITARDQTEQRVTGCWASEVTALVQRGASAANFGTCSDSLAVDWAVCRASVTVALPERARSSWVEMMLPICANAKT